MPWEGYWVYELVENLSLLLALQTQLKSCGECRKLFTRIGCVWRQLKGLHLEHSWRPIFSIANGMQTNCNEQTIPTKGEECEALGMLQKEVSRNCSQVFEAMQFASFQTEYEYENPIQEKPANTLIPPNEHKENAKAISWNRLGKYILFLMWHVFLSVLCDWAT